MNALQESGNGVGMRASNNRTNPDIAGTAFNALGQACLLSECSGQRTEKVQPSRQILVRKPRYPTRKARSWVTLELSEILTWGFFLRPKSNPQWSTEMKPSSWDTSVFVPNSSRIAALIVPERVAPPSPFPSPAATLRHIPFRALMRGDG